MSNILREKSDIYNFSDNTKKVNRRQRSRTVSLTSKSSKTNVSNDDMNVNNRRDGKWRCDTFKEIVSFATWINDNPPEDKPTIDHVLNLLFSHFTDKCECVNEAPTHLLIGNTFYELFLFKLKNFEKRVIHEEINYSECDSIPNCFGTRNNPINDIPINKSTKFESYIISELVNFTNMSDLVEPLKEAMTHWNEALVKGIKYKTITDDSLIKLQVYYNISAVFQVFAFYNMHEYQLKAAILLDKFCRYYSTKHSEIRLTASYYLIKTYIELGAIGKAVSCLNSCSYANSDGNSMPETYGTSLILLAKCELDLINGYVERAAVILKSFLQSDYLQKLTINRYFIKGLALLIASKFNGNQFEFSTCFQEFVEPIQMAVCILKRWHPFLSSTKSNNENAVIKAGDLDPVWYRFAVINFAYKAMQLSANFYINIEMPVDAIFYFNSLLKLARRHCAVVWVSKLLIIGSQFDAICDHKYYAQTKLINAALNLSVMKYISPVSSVFTSESSTSTISPETKRAFEGRYKRLVVKSEYENDPIMTINPTYCGSNYDLLQNDVCGHENFDLWGIKKKLIKLENDDNSDSGDYVADHKPSTVSSCSDDDSDFKDVIDLFLIKLEIDLNKLMVNDNDSAYILRQLKDIFLNSIETYTSNVLRLKIDNMLKNNDKKSYKITSSQLEKNGLSKALKFQICKYIAKFQVETKEFEDAIETCNQITSLSTFSYEERIIKSELLYLEAFSKFQLWKIKHNDLIDYVWVEFDNSLMESVSQITTVSTHTPSPPLNKNKTSIPKAPKQKKGFKNEELQDYMNALRDAVYKEGMENKTNASTSKRVPLQTKIGGNNKKLFENDSISRTLSQSEANDFFTNEPIANLVGIDVINKQNSQRITRSRSTSLRQIKEIKEICDTNKSIIEKRSILLTSQSFSELTDECFESIEELDEVFQEKLNINENLKASQKFSEDNYNLESIIKILSKVSQLMSSHPSVKLYVSIHKLLVQIYSLQKDFNEDTVGYHFSESSCSAAYRYRNLFIAEKKRKLNKQFKYDIQHFLFKRIDDSNNSIKSLTKVLPNDWRVIQISAVENDTKIPDLLVCRYQNGKKPVFLKIKTSPEKIIKHFMVQFREIIERSNASIINKDRETFWRLRFSLDEELMILLRSVEETWFGPFRGLLYGQLLNKDYQQMCLNLMSYILGLANDEDLKCINEELLFVVIESLPSLKYLEFKTAMKLLFKMPSNHFISKCYSKYEELFFSIYPIENKESIFITFKMSSVGLILDKSLEAFPFESLPSLLSYNQSIFRTPSVRILSLMVNAFKDDIYANGINDSSVYYVLNPANNLAKTEEYFKESFLSVKDWEGVIGQSPNSNNLRDAFESKDVYIFFGHGAGASYYRAIPEGLDGVSMKSTSLIIGCSSGKLFSEGKHLESYGTPYRFMMNGAPSYVGVLWDVTDKDIDKFSDQLLSCWFSNWKTGLNVNREEMPITKAVCLSRSICKLKHLIGAAPVVYGLPLFTRSKST